MILATATGKYVPISETAATDMAADFVDDPSWVFRPPPDGLSKSRQDSEDDVR